MAPLNMRRQTMTRKEALLGIFNIGIDTDTITTVLLSVKHKDYPRAEIIAVPRENFELKAKYIAEYYNEELALKSCEDIKIVNVRAINKEGGAV